DNWATQPDTQPAVGSSIKTVERINERIVFLGHQVSEDQLSRAFILQMNEKETVPTDLANLSEHEEHHLAHIEIALSPCWTMHRVKRNAVLMARSEIAVL